MEESSLNPQMNIYQKYKHALSTTIKSDLVYRENEIEEIEQFLNVHLKSKESTSIYISGPPGTGKTASVGHILDKIEGNLKFNKLWLNGMSFPTTASFYKKILSELTNKDSTSKDLIPLIVKALSRPRKPMFVLVLDEIDILDSRHQEMLYTIFNFPRHKSTRVIIIGIANTLDFTNKTLTRYHSLDIDTMKEVVFQPYDTAKIAGILKTRIANLIEEQQLFQDAAIEFCAKKVSSYSGDVRKSLEIMRRSVELVEQEMNKTNPLKEQNQLVTTPKRGRKAAQPIKMVTIVHVMKIVNQVFGDMFVDASQDDYNFPVQQKLVLCAIVLVSIESPKNLNLGKCYDRFRRIAKDKLLTEIEVNNTNLFYETCEILETKSFITIQKSRDLRCSKLFLSISVDEVKDLLKSNHICSSFLH